jgi:hypothetical protein
MCSLRLFMFALLTPTLLLGQKYEVHLSPKNHVGDVFVYAGKGTRSQQVSIAGQIVKQEAISAELEATAEVLGVDAAGEPVRVAFTISKFTNSEDGAVLELLKPGSVVLVDGGVQDPISLKGGKLPDEARKAFGVVYSPHKPGSATDDDVFGTKDPKAFGESWPINVKLASEDARKSGIEVSPEHVKGRTELISKDRVGETDCLNVHADLIASGVGVKDLPAGATANDGTMQAAFDGCVPIGGTSLRKGVEMTFKVRFTSNASIIDYVGRQKSSEIWKEVRK